MAFEDQRIKLGFEIINQGFKFASLYLWYSEKKDSRSEVINESDV